jgi:putative nucleotidyltransferase with HDIG domain
VFALAAAGVLIGSVVATQQGSLEFDYLLAGGFAASFFVMRLVTLRFPQGDEIAITLVVGLAAMGLLHVGELLAASLAVGLLDAMARFAQSSQASNVGRAIDAVRSAAVLAIVSPWQLVLQPVIGSQGLSDAVLVPVLAAGVSYAIVDVLTIAVQQWAAGGAPIHRGVLLLVRPLGNIYMVHIAMGAVVLRVYPVLGLWALAIALLMTLILQNSFNLYLRIRRAYAETIGALAHAAELDRPQDSGHAQRVADLSIAVGRHMGLSSHDLEQLGYAALLHDIGRIGHGAEADEANHALRGAEIVASIPFLADISPLIEHHHVGVEDEQLGAAIIGVCSSYDRLRGRFGAAVALDAALDQGSDTRREVGKALEAVVHQTRTRQGRVW